MSLVIRITANEGPLITMVTAQRVGDNGEQPDSVNVYDVRRYDRPQGYVSKTCEATVAHRYGDGAAVLARKALEAVTT